MKFRHYLKNVTPPTDQVTRLCTALLEPKIEDLFTDKNQRRVWQGIKNITNYKNNNHSTVYTDASLAEELNHFFAHFKVKQPTTFPALPPTSGTCHLTLQEYEVRRVLKTVNIRKAAGPNGVSGKVLQACANQFVGVFSKIFSLTSAIIPPCLKSATIIPVPKKSIHQQFERL